MDSQHTLDLACGDAIVIVTRAATLRVDCHRMDGDWSLLLQYQADAQCPTACNEQSPRSIRDDGPQLERSREKEPLPNRLKGSSRRTQDDETKATADQMGVAVDDLGTDRIAEVQEPAEFGVIRKLGDLPPDAVISEDGLAKLFGRCRTSIKRAVRRGELPPSVRMFGESVWTVEALRSHMNKRLEAANKEVKQLQQRISRLRP